MNINQAVNNIYPNAVHLRDFIVQDDSDGNGPYIAQWDLPDPQPTSEQLQAAWEQVKDVAEPPSLQQQISDMQDVINLLLAGG